MPISRGEVYFVELGPVIGKELNVKRRPVLVLSINDINSKPLVITVVPGTKAAGKQTNLKNSVFVAPTSANGLKCDTLFQCHQVRSLDHSRFSLRAVGRIAPSDLLRVEAAARYCLGL